eukprot:3716900-Pyramimonas_sp.AAC.1
MMRTDNQQLMSSLENKSRGLKSLQRQLGAKEEENAKVVQSTLRAKQQQLDMLDEVIEKTHSIGERDASLLNRLLRVACP